MPPLTSGPFSSFRFRYWVLHLSVLVTLRHGSSYPAANFFSLFGGILPPRTQDYATAHPSHWRDLSLETNGSRGTHFYVYPPICARISLGSCFGALALVPALALVSKSATLSAPFCLSRLRIYLLGMTRDEKSYLRIAGTYSQSVVCRNKALRWASWPRIASCIASYARARVFSDSPSGLWICPGAPAQGSSTEKPESRARKKVCRWTSHPALWPILSFLRDIATSAGRKKAAIVATSEAGSVWNGVRRRPKCGLLYKDSVQERWLG